MQKNLIFTLLKREENYKKIFATVLLIFCLATSVRKPLTILRASFHDIPTGADTCTSPFFTIRIDSLLVRLYVTCIAIETNEVIDIHCPSNLCLSTLTTSGRVTPAYVCVFVVMAVYDMRGKKGEKRHFCGVMCSFG